MNLKHGLLLPLLMICVSCSSKKSLTILSDPSGANVQVNGRLVGKTPVTTTIDQSKAVDIFVEKSGYQCASRALTPEVSTMGAILWTEGDPKAKFIREDSVNFSLKKLDAPSMPLRPAQPKAPVKPSKPADRPVPVLRDMPSFS